MNPHADTCDLTLRKAVLTAAGLGTRLLPATKELPKEMLPIFVPGKNGPVLKPLLQALFEQLFNLGIREFCVVVGRGKRAIEDHFTPNWDFVEKLRSSGKDALAEELESFYGMLERSEVVWVNQPSPLGFGDAVRRAKAFIDEDFMVCAGDTYIASRNGGYLRRLAEVHRRTGSDATLLLKEVDDPRRFGVAVVERSGTGEALTVRSVVEKPQVPPSRMAILPFYAFTVEVFRALERTGPGHGGEIQLTDAIQLMVSEGRKVNATVLEESEVWLDIGTPEGYRDAVLISYRIASEAGADAQ
jgi:UTP--glucose-1-phosphate uridylyltransferase